MSFSPEVPADFLNVHLWNRVKDRDSVLQLAVALTGRIARNKNLLQSDVTGALEDSRNAREPGKFFGLRPNEVKDFRDVLNAKPYYQMAFFVKPNGKFGAKHVAFRKEEKAEGALFYDQYTKERVIESEGDNLAQVMHDILPKLVKNYLPTDPYELSKSVARPAPAARSEVKPENPVTTPAAIWRAVSEKGGRKSGVAQ